MVAKFVSPFKEFGFVSGLLYGIGRVLYRVGVPVRLFFYELMVQPISDRALVPPSLRNGIEVREITVGDPALALMPVSSEVLLDRFAKPTVCLGAFRDNQLVAYMWLCLGPYEEDEVRCLFDPQPANQAVWDFDFYVFPNHRLGMGFVCLWDGANAFLRERGIRFSCSRVTRFNMMSRKAHKHFKWERIGHTLFLRASRFQAMLATVPPYLHVAFGDSSRPVIQIWTGSKTKP
jgi:hypothetical protein